MTARSAGKNENSGKKLRVCYVCDEKLIEECNRLPAVLGRASVVHNLIAAYGLLDRVKVVRAMLASYEDLKIFHSESYLQHLKELIDIDDEYMSSTKDEVFGIGYDCTPVSNMFNLVSTIAGGSITAAKCLMLGISDVAINWYGGWHHANSSSANGFCYVNDIVLAIEMLRRQFPKILYVDLDVHHGDGVQNAYITSNSVFTLSFHKYEVGFFPGTGNIDEIGIAEGEGYSCNFPLHENYSDNTLEYAFKSVFNSVYDIFSPNAIVVQCGADALALDPKRAANLTQTGYTQCMKAVLSKRKPTVLLGGGGYNYPNTARLWTTLMALVTDVNLEENIPEHNNWPQYGPGFMLTIEPTLAKDNNKIEYLDQCIVKIKDNLIKYLESSKNNNPRLKEQRAELNKSNKEVISNNTKRERLLRYLNGPNQQICDDAKNEDVYDFVDL